MQLKTILNRVQRHGAFVYEAVRFVETAAEPWLEVTLKARANSCHGIVRAKFWIPEMAVEPHGSDPKNREKSMVAKFESGMRAEYSILL
jgi:hypothetical protein